MDKDTLVALRTQVGSKGYVMAKLTYEFDENGVVLFREPSGAIRMLMARDVFDALRLNLNKD